MEAYKNSSTVHQKGLDTILKPVASKKKNPYSYSEKQREGNILPSNKNIYLQWKKKKIKKDTYTLAC